MVIVDEIRPQRSFVVSRMMPQVVRHIMVITARWGRMKPSHQADTIAFRNPKTLRHASEISAEFECHQAMNSLMLPRIQSITFLSNQRASDCTFRKTRSEERRVGKECRSRSA